MTSHWAHLLSPAALERFEALKRVDPAVAVAALTMGDRVLEWWLATAPLTDPAAAALFPPMPPEPLRRVVSDYQPEMFLWTGVVDAETFLGAVEGHAEGVKERRKLSFVDFGGGCGRVSRHLVHHPRARTLLLDANPRHVDWCREHIPGIETACNGSDPPVAGVSVEADGLLAISVFTHLPSAAVDAWLAELRRLTAPGGVIVATFHGPKAVTRIATNPTLQSYFRMTPAVADATADEVRRSGFVYRQYDDDQLEAASAGKNYGSTFVSKEEVERRAAAAGLKVLEYRETGLRGWQDLAILGRSR